MCRVREAGELSTFLELPPPHSSGPKVPHVTFQSWWVGGGGAPPFKRRLEVDVSACIEPLDTGVCFLPVSQVLEEDEE